MKNKIASLTLILTLLLALALPSLAVEIPGYEGGINNENNYKEVIFITGEPIELEGTLDIKISEKNRKGVQTKTYTYKYDLHNVKLGATLRRNITYRKPLKLTVIKPHLKKHWTSIRKLLE